MSAVTPARSPGRIQADYFTLVSDGKIERAQQFVDAALAKWPEDPNVLSSALLHASRVGEFDQAMNFARQLEVLARKTGDETLLVNYFWLVTAVLLQQNKLQEAKDILRKIPEQLASNLLIQFSKAYLLRLEWRLDEADKMMARIYRSIEPKNPFVQLQWGWTQQHAGRYEEALATFRALKNSAIPGAEDLYPDAEALYCETLTFMGEWDEALERLSELRSKYPFNVLTLQVTAMVMLRRHRYSEVLDVADKIMSLFLGDTAAFQLKAAALTRLGRLHEAQQIIAEGLQISPLSAGLLVYRGWVNFALHDLDTAEEDFSAIASKSPHDPTSHTGLAAVAFQRRDYQEAFDLFTKVAKISVIDPGTQANLALTLAAMGDDEASARPTTDNVT